MQSIVFFRITENHRNYLLRILIIIFSFFGVLFYIPSGEAAGSPQVLLTLVDAH